MVAPGHDRAEWVDHALMKEQERIQHALSFLAPICDALKQVGDVIVIKSLDHWPDLGNDLDLYTNAEPPNSRRHVEEVSRPSRCSQLGRPPGQ